MEGLRADIVEFLKSLITTIIGFLKGTDVELTEDQIKGIEAFVAFIFMQ